MAEHGKELKCIDCGKREFVEYNGPILACEDCGQFFDTRKDFGDARQNTKEAQANHQLTQPAICPKCDNPYPHLYKDGSYWCEECEFGWEPGKQQADA